MALVLLKDVLVFVRGRPGGDVAIVVGEAHHILHERDGQGRVDDVNFGIAKKECVESTKYCVVETDVVDLFDDGI